MPTQVQTGGQEGAAVPEVLLQQRALSYAPSVCRTAAPPQSPGACAPAGCHEPQHPPALAHHLAEANPRRQPSRLVFLALHAHLQTALTYEPTQHHMQQPAWIDHTHTPVCVLWLLDKTADDLATVMPHDTALAASSGVLGFAAQAGQVLTGKMIGCTVPHVETRPESANHVHVASCALQAR